MNRFVDILGEDFIRIIFLIVLVFWGYGFVTIIHGLNLYREIFYVLAGVTVIVLYLVSVKYRAGD